MTLTRLFLLAVCVAVVGSAGCFRRRQECCRPDTIVVPPPPVAAGYCDNCR
jgi:hypothetical protein